MERANTRVNYTFWNKQRLKKGVVIATVAKNTGLPIGALRTYFSGEHIPREYALMKICNYFGVSVEEGRAGFISDHELWEQRHTDEWRNHDKQRETKYHKEWSTTHAYTLCVSFSRTNDIDLLSKINTIECGQRGSYVKWVLRQHLGNDEFSTERLTPEVQNLLKVIYSEVPFEIFMKMLSSLVDTKTIDAHLLYGYVSYPTFLEIYRLQDKI